MRAVFIGDIWSWRQCSLEVSGHGSVHTGCVAMKECSLEVSGHEGHSRVFLSGHEGNVHSRVFLSGQCSLKGFSVWS